MTASERHRHLTTPLGERVEQRGIIATTAALIALGAAATAGGAVASSAISTRGNTKASQTAAAASDRAAQLQTESANKAAELEAQSAREALDFTKLKDTEDRAAADKAARLNYDQWATQQRRIGTLGSMLGVGGRDPGPYDSVINPSSSGGGTSGGSGTSGGGNTLPGSGEVDWNASPDVLTTQLNNYFTKRGAATSETPYWVSKAAELVARGKEIGDPNYASMRLSKSDVFGGGYGGGATSAKSTKPTTGLAAYVAPYRASNRYVQTSGL